MTSTSVRRSRGAVSLSGVAPTVTVAVRTGLNSLWGFEWMDALDSANRHVMHYDEGMLQPPNPSWPFSQHKGDFYEVNAEVNALNSICQNPPIERVQ
jgi:hypothetical protein